MPLSDAETKNPSAAPLFKKETNATGTIIILRPTVPFRKPLAAEDLLQDMQRISPVKSGSSG
jgi:hypothetical protein